MDDLPVDTQVLGAPFLLYLYVCIRAPHPAISVPGVQKYREHCFSGDKI